MSAHISNRMVTCINFGKKCMDNRCVYKHNQDAQISIETAIEARCGKATPHKAPTLCSFCFAVRRLVVHNTFSSMKNSRMLCKSGIIPLGFASPMQVKLPISASGSMLSCLRAWMASQEAELHTALWVPCLCSQTPKLLCYETVSQY